VVNGAKQQQVWSFDQAIILMNYGEESRVYKETNVHEHSSRSHTLFRVVQEIFYLICESYFKHSLLKVNRIILMLNILLIVILAWYYLLPKEREYNLIQ